MEFFFVKVNSANEAERISPSNFDIRYIRKIIDLVEKLFDHKEGAEYSKKLITLAFEEGSHVHRFGMDLLPEEVTTTIHDLNESFALSSIPEKKRDIWKEIEKISRVNNWNLDLYVNDIQNKVSFTPQTKIQDDINSWVEGEFYVYGVFKDIGGKIKTNIHLESPEHGYIKINIKPDILEGFEENLFNKVYGVNIHARQNVYDGSFQSNSIKFIDLVEYNPEIGEGYLKEKIKNASENLKNVDVDSYLNWERDGE